MGNPHCSFIRPYRADFIQKIRFIPTIPATKLKRVLESPYRQRNSAMVAQRVLIGGDGIKAEPTENVGKTIVKGVPAMLANLRKKEV
jgi:hypothetical protein